jgi:periplasmic protein TonB
MGRSSQPHNEHGAEPDPLRPQSSAFVRTGLVGASFALGAIGTLLFLTGGSIQSPELMAPAVDATQDAAASAVTAPGPGEPEVPDGRPSPSASRPPVSSRGAPLPESGAENPRPDGVDLAPAPLPPPAASAPRAVHAMSSEPERADLEVLFDVPTGGDVVFPVKTKNVAPAYPRVARKARIGGVVVLEAVITAEGRVADVRVANSAPLLDDAAVAAIRKWQYEPAQLNQRPVAMPVTINVAFSMP